MNAHPDSPESAPDTALDTAGGGGWSVPPETRRSRRGHDFYPPHEQLAAIPTIDQLRRSRTSPEDLLVHLHYVSSVGDWWLTALDRGHDPEDWIGHGYVCLSGAHQFAEWGDVWLPELEALYLPAHPTVIVERDLWWTRRPLARIGDTR